jgi:hypothetical protein
VGRKKNPLQENTQIAAEKKRLENTKNGVKIQKMAKLPAAMIDRKKRPWKQLPAAMSSANSCTQTNTMPPIYRRPRPSLLPAMPADCILASAPC